MDIVKDNIKGLIENSEKLSLTGGPASAAFQRMHMEEIKKLEKEIKSSDKPDVYFASLRKHLNNSNRAVRERVAYIIGELMLLHPTSKEIGLCVNKLVECTQNSLYFQPVNTAGREIVNALGKSGRAEAENPLLQLLSSPTTQTIRQFILVALGKTGGSKTVYVLSDFIKHPKLSIPDKIYAIWALGKLGSVQNTTRSEFPLPRSIFEQSLVRIIQIIQSNVTHPTIHYCSLYAVGEICDQRDRTDLKDSIQSSTLKRAENVISSIKNRRTDIRQAIQNNQKFRIKADLHTRNLIDISEKVALKMIRGQKLDPEGEKILFSVRILFDVIPSPGTDIDLPDALTLISREPIEQLIEISSERGKGIPQSGIISPEEKFIPEPTYKPNSSKSSEQASSPAHSIQSSHEKPSSTESNHLTSLDRDKYEFLSSAEEIREEIEHQNTLRKEFVKRLRNLEIEQAKKGIDTPPQTTTQIEDIHKTLREIETKILTLIGLTQLNRE